MTSLAKQSSPDADRGKSFTIFVDGTEYHIEHAEVSGREIMDLAGIPLEVGLLLCEEDGTQRRVEPDETIELKPGRRFKKAPRFKRGSA